MAGKGNTEMVARTNWEMRRVVEFIVEIEKRGPKR